MKPLKINEIFLMNDNDIVYVRKEAIYIQILDYEKNNSIEQRDKLLFLTNVIANIFSFELKKMMQKKRVEMTVLQIKTNFNKNNYYPTNSFVQYVPTDDELT